MIYSEGSKLNRTGWKEGGIRDDCQSSGPRHKLSFIDLVSLYFSIYLSILLSQTSNSVFLTKGPASAKFLRRKEEKRLRPTLKAARCGCARCQWCEWCRLGLSSLHSSLVVRFCGLSSWLWVGCCLGRPKLWEQNYQKLIQTKQDSREQVTTSSSLQGSLQMGRKGDQRDTSVGLWLKGLWLKVVERIISAY